MQFNISFFQRPRLRGVEFVFDAYGNQQNQHQEAGKADHDCQAAQQDILCGSVRVILMGYYEIICHWCFFVHMLILQKLTEGVIASFGGHPSSTYWCYWKKQMKLIEEAVADAS